MPYRRGDYWYLDRRLPGYGRFGPLSTRTTRTETAEAIEAFVVSLNDRGRRDVLELLKRGRLDLFEAWTAHVEGRLEELLTRAGSDRDDAPLAEAVEAFLIAVDDSGYRSTFRWILKAAPGGARVSWLADSGRIQALLNGRIKDGKAPGTLERDLGAISAFLGHRLGESRRHELIHKRIRTPRVENARTRWLSRREIDRVRAVSGDWWLVWALLLSTGIRRGELVGLRVEDVDLETGQLRVWGTKSKAAKRVLPLEGEVPALLRGWIAANDLGPSDRLFPGLERKQGHWVWLAWRQCCELAGVEDVTVHDLRHTFAVHATKAGMPLPELQRRLGHSRMQETWRYASFVPPATSEHVAAALDRMGLASNENPDIQRETVAAGGEVFQRL